MSMGRRGSPVPDPGTDRVVRELSRLDPWSYWRTAEEGGTVTVVGVTGAWVVAAFGGAGEVTSLAGRVKVGDRTVPVRRLKRMAKQARTKLGSASVDMRVEPVVCCTDAHLGKPKVAGGVRFVPVGSLVRDLTDREKVLQFSRAQKAAEALGLRKIAAVG
jgi:hypothetical protein